MIPAAIFIVSVLAGATASVVGFGIGSLLTPLVAVTVGTDLAVAAVLIPHAVATALRCWRLRVHIDWRVLRGFGLLSAAGALAGAIAYSQIGSSTLTRILGALLVLTALSQLTGWAARWPARGPLVALFGLLSGFFGGVAGNQGGLRAAAMTAFGLAPTTFVATATATGLLVDAARTPVYLWSAGADLLPLWPTVATAVAGVIAGTLIGERVLLGLWREQFGRLIAVAVGILGIWLLA